MTAHLFSQHALRNSLLFTTCDHGRPSPSAVSTRVITIEMAGEPSDAP